MEGGRRKGRSNLFPCPALNLVEEGVANLSLPPLALASSSQAVPCAQEGGRGGGEVPDLAKVKGPFRPLSAQLHAVSIGTTGRAPGEE